MAWGRGAGRLCGCAPQPGGEKPREAGFFSEVVQAGVRRLERGFRVNQAVFQNFGTGRGGIVSA